MLSGLRLASTTKAPSVYIDRLGLDTGTFANTAVMSGLQHLRALTLVLVAVTVLVDATSNIPRYGKWYDINQSYKYAIASTQQYRFNIICQYTASYHVTSAYQNSISA